MPYYKAVLTYKGKVIDETEPGYAYSIWCKDATLMRQELRDKHGLTPRQMRRITLQEVSCEHDECYKDVTKVLERNGEKHYYCGYHYEKAAHTLEERFEMLAERVERLEEEIGRCERRKDMDYW